MLGHKDGGDLTRNPGGADHLVEVRVEEGFPNKNGNINTNTNTNKITWWKKELEARISL